MVNSLVSIVVPAYNAQKTLGSTLKAILSQTYSDSIEIIVVDDGSTDQTTDLVKSFENIVYIYQKNAGPATARNRGFSIAKGDFVFFTDSDCIPHVDWIQKSMDHFSDISIGVVCGSYGIANPKNLLARCIHKEILFRHKTLMPDFPKSFGSYNFCVRKNIFEAAGGFDSQYRSPSGEDNNLSYKILNLGSKIYFERRSIVDHFFPVSFKKYFLEQFRHGFWRVKVYISHPLMARGDDYTFWKDIAEPGLVFSFLMATLLSIVGFPVFSGAILLLLLLLAIELFYGFLMTKNVPEGIFLSGIMFIRSFYRSLGFAYGITRFFLPKLFKKNQ